MDIHTYASPQVETPVLLRNDLDFLKGYDKFRIVGTGNTDLQPGIYTRKTLERFLGPIHIGKQQLTDQQIKYHIKDMVLSAMLHNKDLKEVPLAELSYRIDLLYAEVLDYDEPGVDVPRLRLDVHSSWDMFELLNDQLDDYIEYQYMGGLWT